MAWFLIHLNIDQYLATQKFSLSKSLKLLIGGCDTSTTTQYGYAIIADTIATCFGILLLRY